MAPITGIKERLHNYYFSSWIADTRKGGLGVSKDLSFKSDMNLFYTDLGNHFRTNMKCAGHLPSDRTMRIQRVGICVSFSDRMHYERFFNETSFTLKVLGNSAFAFEPLDLCKKKKLPFTASGAPRPMPGNSITLFEPNRSHPGTSSYETQIDMNAETPPAITIPTRADFHLKLESGADFTEVMQQLESGELQGYAEITGILDVVHVRDIL